MNKHRAWQYGLLVLALLLSSPVSQAVPIPVAFSLTLERLPPGSRDGNDPDREILGSGSFRLDVEIADSAIRQFQDDYEFCLFHGSDPEHEGFCSMIGDQIWVDVPVLFGEFEMFGHTFTTADIQWNYNYSAVHELSYTLHLAFGGARWCPDSGLCSEPQDPFLTFSSDGESGTFAYLVNGFMPVGDPWCDNDNDTCEFLREGPALPVPEPGSLGLLGLGLLGLGLTRRRTAN